MLGWIDLDQAIRRDWLPFERKRLPKVATEMALHVLAYNLGRAMNIMGVQPPMPVIRA